MIGFGWFFMYTPLPWLVILYVAAYRHDLGRIARPLRDSASPTDWWRVCAYLGLKGASTERPTWKPWRWPSFIALPASFVVSLLWLFIPLPDAWYYLCLTQVCSALPLVILLRIRLGPFPHKPFKDLLPFPRLGSRTRHVQRRKGTMTNAATPSGAAERRSS